MKKKEGGRRRKEKESEGQGKIKRTKENGGRRKKGDGRRIKEDEEVTRKQRERIANFGKDDLEGKVSGERGGGEHVGLPGRQIIVAEDLSDQHQYDPLSDCVCSLHVGR